MNVTLALRDERADVSPLRLILPMAAGSAAFGAAVGSYVGGWQIAYAAIKMPIFLLGTLAICMAILTALAAQRMGVAAAVGVAVRTIFTTSMILGALAPPVFLAGISVPKPNPRGYAAMVLLLTLAVGLAGTISVVRLRRALPSVGLWLAWIGIYGFVGAQMAWLLKPWIGHTLIADRFIPLRQNLHGNFYEAAWGTLMNFVR